MKQEKIAHGIFLLCATLSILAVASVTIYMIKSGAPAFLKIGVKEILFGTHWMPTAENPSYGIAFIILTSLVGTTAAIAIGVPIGLLTAIFLAEIAPKKFTTFIRPAVELLAGIPSVIYGMIGLMVLTPFMYKVELKLFSSTGEHQFTGGANLLSAVIVLAIMILPTIVTMSETALRALPNRLREASLALGASKLQTIFKVLLPAAKSGIVTAVVLGVGRAIGEAMAISLVAGSAVNLPLPFSSVRFLTTAIVSEMGYAEGMHREVLFSIGLVLFTFILGINLILTLARRKGERHEG
ncbi:MAG: phosphate ABC transporter permease subunit PstC [Lachnospiraceae bacterium]